MSRWNQPELWAELCSGAACPICRRGIPLHVVAELEGSWLTASADAPMPGYVCLVARTHAVDLHHLPAPDAAAFFRDAHRVSQALSTATGAIKLNYEIHGNTLPHFHMHFFPRYPGDPFEGRPIDPRPPANPVYGPGDFERFHERLLAALGE